MHISKRRVMQSVVYGSLVASLAVPAARIEAASHTHGSARQTAATITIHSKGFQVMMPGQVHAGLATACARSSAVRPSAAASSSTVIRRGICLSPRSRSLTARGLKVARSASSLCVNPAARRNCRSSVAKSGEVGIVIAAAARCPHHPHVLPFR